MAGRYAPRSDSEGSEALCVLIRKKFVLLKERTDIRVLCEMIEIRRSSGLEIGGPSRVVSDNWRLTSDN